MCIERNIAAAAAAAGHLARYIVAQPPASCVCVLYTWEAAEKLTPFELTLSPSTPATALVVEHPPATFSRLIILFKLILRIVNATTFNSLAFILLSLL